MHLIHIHTINVNQLNIQTNQIFKMLMSVVSHYHIFSIPVMITDRILW